MVKPSTCGQSPTSPPTTEHVSEGSSSSSSSKYKGVRKRKWGKWVSEIRLPNSRERIWLGSYDSAEKAARAFDAALYCLRGRDAKFNFPKNPPEIVGGRSLNPQEIQMVAARFANEVVVEAAQSHSFNDNNVTRTEQVPQYTSSSSMSVSDGGGAPTTTTTTTTTTQVESHETMDWSSFFNMLDTTNQGISDYDDHFYSGLGHLPGDNDDHHQLVYPPPPTDTYNMINDDDQNDGDVFSQSSFLWNF
ncbi:hypothetical protein PTKIN_Ptkin03bG0216800 [Pterospermum kingtungense]